MKPYYDRDGITIFHGDCREILPTLDNVDLVLTDPPYGIADIWKGGAGGKSSWRIAATETHGWDNATCQEGIELAIGKARSSIVWGGNYYSLPPSRCWLIWDKKQNDEWTTSQAEMAWTNLDRTVRCFRMAQCEAHAKKEMEGKRHPSQKPLSLLKWCFKWCDSQTILDPFMGSGTTLRAAKDLGRKCIGIEIEEKYCEIAANRLRQGVLDFST